MLSVRMSLKRVWLPVGYVFLRIEEGDKGNCFKYWNISEKAVCLIVTSSRSYVKACNGSYGDWRKDPHRRRTIGNHTTNRDEIGLA